MSTAPGVLPQGYCPECVVIHGTCTARVTVTHPGGTTEVLREGNELG